MAQQLTGKQIAFAHYVAEGLTASEAYRRAYSDRGSKGTTKDEAYKVRKNKLVAAYIEMLREEMRNASRLTREDVLNRLDRIVIDPDVSVTGRVHAIKVRNEMTGDNAPQKVDIFGLGELLGLIRKKTG